jgi:hypothetical protein
MRVFIYLLLFLAWAGIFQGNTLNAQTTCPQLELRLDKLTCRDVTVFWRVPLNISSYEVKYRNLATNWDSSFSVNQNSAYLKLPQGGQNYRVEVSYLCNGRPVVSTLEFAAPLCPVPCPEPTITVNDVRCDGASISWNLVPNVYDYTVVYHVKGNPSNAITLTPNTNNATLNNLASSQTYEVTVSYPCEGRRISKTIEIATPACPPPCPPLRPRVENLSCDKFTVVWEAPISTGLCTVTVRSANQNPPQFLLTQGQSMQVTASPNTVYQITVSYICNSGTNIEVVTSNVIEVRTPECPPPCPPLQPRVENLSCDKFTVVWDTPAPTGLCTVTVRSANQTPPQFLLTQGQSMEVTARPNTVYQITVSYICNRGTNIEIVTSK